MQKAAQVLIEMLLEQRYSEEDIEDMADSGDLDELIDDLFEEYLEEAIRHSGGRAHGAFRDWKHGRMSASSPEDLTIRYVDHYGMSTDPFGHGPEFKKTAQRHAKAANLILKHVEKEHGLKSAKALRVAGKHAGRLTPEGYFDGDKQERIEKAVSTNSTKKFGDYIAKNAKGKRVFEEFDTQGLDKETLMEIKMKLKPGQKMTPKQFAQMKAEVLAKQKQKAAKKAAPKPAPKEEKVETDDTNRNARILKGQFPWGTVTQTLATAARSSLMQIEKPHNRLKAMDKIWKSKDHFNALLGGRLDLKDDDNKKKSGPSLPKITGVND